MNDYSDVKMITQPKNMTINLYPHQLASVYEMEKRELERKVSHGSDNYEVKMGILADKTGFGKTISMVALLTRDKMKWDTSSYYTNEETNSFYNNHIIRR